MVLDLANNDFDAVYQTHYSIVLNYINGWIGNRHISEELTQEVFLKQYLNPPKIPSKELKFWLFRTARNLIIDYYRRDKKVSIVDYEIDDIPDSLDLLEHRVLSVDFENIINTLPDEQREVIMRRYGRNYSLANLAEYFGRSQDSIKGLIYRAICNIQQNEQFRQDYSE